MTRNEMRDWVGGCMKSQGFHKPELDNWHGAMVRAALIGTEAAEVVQEFKRHWSDRVSADVIDRVAAELADTAIRSYDLAAVHGLDLDLADTDIDVDWSWPKTGGLNSRHTGMAKGGFLLSLANGVYECVEQLANEEHAGWRVEESKTVLGQSVVALLVKLEQMAEWVGRDLTAAIDKKMAENMARPYRYGTPDAAPVPSNDGELPAGVPFSFRPVQVYPAQSAVPVCLGTDGPVIGSADVAADGSAVVMVTDAFRRDGSVVVKKSVLHVGDSQHPVANGESVTLWTDGTPDGLRRVAESLRRIQNAGCDHEGGGISTAGD